MPGLTRFVWPSPKRDHSGTDVSRHLFEELDIDGQQEPVSFFRADFRGSRLARSRFVKVDFSRSDFPETSIQSCIFDGCTFDHFGLQSAFVDDAAFSGCHAHTSEISESRLLRTRFSASDLLGSTLVNSVFEECDFQRVGFERCTIENNHFDRCRFSQIDLGNQSLLHCTFTDCEFEDVALDVDVLSTCTGLSMKTLDGVRFTRRGQPMAMTAEKLIRDLFGRHRERHELVEACNLAVILGDSAAFEESLQTLPAALDTELDGFRPLQLVRLARKLLYWNERHAIDPYWLAWTASTVLDRLRGIEGKLDPSPQVLEALSLLLPAVQDYHGQMASLVFSDHVQGSLMGHVAGEVLAVDDATVPGVLNLLNLLNDYAQPRLPTSMAVPGGLLRFEYHSHRKGSLIIEGGAILSGLLFLKMFFYQARGAVREARLFSEELGRLKNQVLRPHPKQATAPTSDGLGTLVPVSQQASLAIQEAANIQLMTSVATRLVVPATVRKELATTLISIDVRTDVTLRK